LMIARLRSAPLQVQMLVGFLIGLVAGLIANLTSGPDAAWISTLTTYVTQPAAQIFLRLLFMLVLPLLFSALVIGIADMEEIKALRRVGLATLLYTHSSGHGAEPRELLPRIFEVSASLR